MCVCVHIPVCVQSSKAMQTLAMWKLTNTSPNYHEEQNCLTHAETFFWKIFLHDRHAYYLCLDIQRSASFAFRQDRRKNASVLLFIMKQNDYSSENSFGCWEDVTEWVIISLTFYPKWCFRFVFLGDEKVVSHSKEGVLGKMPVWTQLWSWEWNVRSIFGNWCL